MRITKLLTIISFILFSIFFTVGISINNITLGALALISILGFFILLVIDLNEQLDEEFDDFFNKYYIHQRIDSDDHERKGEQIC